VLGTEDGQEAPLELADLADRQLIEIAVDAGEDDGDLLLDLERRELRLLEEARSGGRRD